VGQAVESVILQTLAVSEILIIDDASKDNTLKKAREIIEKYSNNKISLFISEKNVGYQANWNRCFDLCKTKYLVILHQDDMMMKDCCEKQCKFLNDNKELALVGGNEVQCNEDGVPGYFKKGIDTDRIYRKGQICEFITERSSYIPCSSVMFNMNLIIEVGGFELGVSGTDELFWPKVLTKYPIGISGSNLILRRIHEGQAEYTSFVNDEKKAIKIYQRFKELSFLEERIEYRKRILIFLKKKFFVGYIAGIAPFLAKHGFIRLSLRYIVKAFRIFPAGSFILPTLWKSILKILYYDILEMLLICYRIVLGKMSFRNYLQKMDKK
jgi:glycosyltransferase involved in cell wall biosynthesis